MEQIFLREIRSYMREMARRWSWEFPSPDPEIEFCFFSWGMTGILLDYCRCGDVDAAQVSQRLCRLVRANFNA